MLAPKDVSLTSPVSVNVNNALMVNTKPYKVAIIVPCRQKDTLLMLFVLILLHVLLVLLPMNLDWLNARNVYRELPNTTEVRFNVHHALWDIHHLPKQTSTFIATHAIQVPTPMS